ncbi:MAG: hypothetical protein V4602_02685 [Pseudomonadota bacterium]
MPMAAAITAKEIDFRKLMNATPRVDVKTNWDQACKPDARRWLIVLRMQRLAATTHTRRVLIRVSIVRMQRTTARGVPLPTSIIHFACERMPFDASGSELPQ